MNEHKLRTVTINPTILHTLKLLEEGMEGAANMAKQLAEAGQNCEGSLRNFDYIMARRNKLILSMAAVEDLMSEVEIKET